MQIYELRSLWKVFEVEIMTDIELESFDSIRKNIFATGEKAYGANEKVLIALYLDTRLLFYSCTKPDARGTRTKSDQLTPTGQLQMKVNIDGKDAEHLSC
jgi:hypothetical protein